MSGRDKVNSFNIRVYALIVNEDNQILLADEERYGIQMTKFPGGGLVPGESTIECLKREAMEEFGQEIEIDEHFYTTDFFQQALFHEDQQLISIYYQAHFVTPIKFRLATLPFDFSTPSDELLSFRFVDMEKLTTDALTFPIDKHVAVLLRKSILL